VGLNSCSSGIELLFLNVTWIVTLYYRVTMRFSLPGTSSRNIKRNVGMVQVISFTKNDNDSSSVKFPRTDGTIPVRRISHNNKTGEARWHVCIRSLPKYLHDDHSVQKGMHVRCVQETQPHLELSHSPRPLWYRICRKKFCIESKITGKKPTSQLRTNHPPPSLGCL